MNDPAAPVPRIDVALVHGRLSAVIDFGCSAVGDPACAPTIAWTLLRGESRETSRKTLVLDAVFADAGNCS